MRRLVALDLPGGAAFVDALRAAWDDGDAVFPVDQRLPVPARSALLDAMRPARVVDAGGTTELPDARPVEADDALVVATSGSTGEPKGAVLGRAAVEASAWATTRRLDGHRDDTWLACLPLAHIGGLSVVTRALIAGTGLTVLPGFDAEEVTRAARLGATLVSLVPTALRRIDPSLFRTVVLGGSHPPAERPANVVVTYGMTETGSGVVYDGVPLDGVDVELGSDGEIRLRGPMLLRSYRDGHDPKDTDGWLPTGDLGSWDEQGRLVVHGRRGDLIVTGAEKVWPEPVERLLTGAPGVVDVAVVGLPDPEWGHRVVAAVVPAAGDPPRLDDLRERVRAALPAYCAPKQLVFCESIPRTALGKIRRPELVRLLSSRDD